MKLNGYTVVKDEELDTLQLVEEYEYQANILISKTSKLSQAAANMLYRLRKEMHKKIHELMETEKCEFCVEETE